MSQETVEYLLRQQGKVKTPKTLVKVVRAHTRELKRARKGETEKAALDLASSALRELIRGGFDVVEESVKGVFSIGTAISANPNPLSQGIAIGGGIVVLGWFIRTFPEAARLLGVDTLFFRGELPPPGPGGEVPLATAQGSFCIQFSSPIVIGPSPACYFTEADRDRAIAIWLRRGVQVTKFDRLVGTWKITGFYQGVRIRVSGGYSSQELAETARQQFITGQLTGATDLRVELE